MTKKLIFIGYRATGKTTLAQLSGVKLGLPFFDTDTLIEQKAEKTISRIFAEEGEPYFRDLETTVLTDVLQQQPSVIATGGGVPIRPENRELLRQFGFVVWLKATPETILHRITTDPISGTRRPNLTNLPPFEEIQQMLRIRDPMYRETAHVEIITENNVSDKMVSLIVEKYRDFR